MNEATTYIISEIQYYAFQDKTTILDKLAQITKKELSDHAADWNAEYIPY